MLFVNDEMRKMPRESECKDEREGSKVRKVCRRIGEVKGRMEGRLKRTEVTYLT